MSGRKNVSSNFHAGLVSIFQSKEFGKRRNISSLNMEEFLRKVVRADTAFSQQIVAVLEAKTERRRLQKFATLFAVTENRLFRRAGTEQVRQTLKESLAVQTDAAGDVRLAQWLSTLFRKKHLS